MILKVIGIIWFAFFFLGFLLSIADGQVEIAVVALIMSILGLLPMVVLRKKSKTHVDKQTLEIAEESPEEIIVDILEVNKPLFEVKVTSTSTPTPQHILDDMRRVYTLVNAQNDIKMLKDCMDLIATTINFETFFYRKEFGMRKIFTLRQAKEAGISVPDIKITSDDFLKFVNSQKPRLLVQAYERLFKKVDSLKTEKAKSKHIVAFYNEVKKYEGEFEFVGNVEYKTLIENLEPLVKQIEVKN